MRTTILVILVTGLVWSSAIAQTAGVPGSNKIRAFDHIVINVADMERAISFYKRLGFELINEDGWRQGRGQVAIKIGENQKINIHKEPTLGPQLTPQKVGPGDLLTRAFVPVAGGADFCVVWDGTVEEAERHLKRSGVDGISPLRQVTGARGPATSVYFRDPDGNLWEFLVYTR